MLDGGDVDVATTLVDSPTSAHAPRLAAVGHALHTYQTPAPPPQDVQEFAWSHRLQNHRSTCPYCHKVGGFHTRGVVVDTLTVDVWLELLNRGWRRFGKYLWHQAEDICCRQYPIRTNVRRHTPNRDNRKVWKRLEKFLRTDGAAADDGAANDSTINKAKRNCLSCSKPMQLVVKTLPHGYSLPTCDVCHGTNIHLEEEGFLHCPNCLLDTHVKCQYSSFCSQIISSIPQGFLWNYMGSRQLQVRVAVPSFSQEKYELFLKYQKRVHSEGEGQVLSVLRITGSDEDETDEAMFRRYLIDSPLCDDVGGSEFRGTFHFEYRLDGELFMTTVTDLLKESVNSVYCFYDPDRMSLAPGKLSILYEMEWMRRQQEYQRFAYYYLGMYVASPKMTYKANYHPAELLSPVLNEWVNFEELFPSDTQ